MTSELGAQLAHKLRALRQLVFRARSAEAALEETGAFLDELKEAASRRVCEAAGSCSDRRLRAAAHDLRAVRSLEEELKRSLRMRTKAEAELAKLTEGGDRSGTGPDGPGDSGHPD